MTPAQRRLVDIIRAHGGADEYGAEYWPAVNDWVREPARALALRNINRTVDALIRNGVVTLDDNGCFHLTGGRDDR
jgi:hypothetical protein